MKFLFYNKQRIKDKVGLNRKRQNFLSLRGTDTINLGIYINIYQKRNTGQISCLDIDPTKGKQRMSKIKKKSIMMKSSHTNEQAY